MKMDRAQFFNHKSPYLEKSAKKQQKKVKNENAQNSQIEFLSSEVRNLREFVDTMKKEA